MPASLPLQALNLEFVCAHFSNYLVIPFKEDVLVDVTKNWNKEVLLQETKSSLNSCGKCLSTLIFKNNNNLKIYIQQY